MHDADRCEYENHAYQLVWEKCWPDPPTGSIGSPDAAPPHPCRPAEHGRSSKGEPSFDRVDDHSGPSKGFAASHPATCVAAATLPAQSANSGGDVRELVASSKACAMRRSSPSSNGRARKVMPIGSPSAAAWVERGKPWEPGVSGAAPSHRCRGSGDVSTHAPRLAEAPLPGRGRAQGPRLPKLTALTHRDGDGWAARLRCDHRGVVAVVVVAEGVSDLQRRQVPGRIHDHIQVFSVHALNEPLCHGRVRGW